MRYTAEQYAQALYESTKDATQDEAQKIFMTFSALLKAQKAQHMIQSIGRAYRALLVKKNILPEVSFVSARSLPDTISRDVLRRLGIASDITIKQATVPAMIGGVYVKYNNRLFDLSIARKLARLQRHLNKKSN